MVLFPTETIAAPAVPSSGVVATSQTTTSASYTDLSTSGPAVTATVSGTSALVMLTANISNSTVGSNCFMGVDISGATTVAAADTRALTTGLSSS